MHPYPTMMPLIHWCIMVHSFISPCIPSYHDDAIDSSCIICPLIHSCIMVHSIHFIMHPIPWWHIPWIYHASLETHPFMHHGTLIHSCTMMHSIIHACMHAFIHLCIKISPPHPILLTPLFCLTKNQRAHPLHSFVSLVFSRSSYYTYMQFKIYFALIVSDINLSP